MPPIYLDHNATTPMLPEVIAAMAECAREALGNPASQHAAGREARRRIEEARETICRLLGAETKGMHANRLVFTSGGTEANNLALLGLVPHEPAHVVVSAIEHPSVLGAAEELVRRGHRVSRLRVLPSGMVDLEHLKELLESRSRLPGGTGSRLSLENADSSPNSDSNRERLGSDPRFRPAGGTYTLVSVMLGNNETGVIQPVAEIARLCKTAGALLHTDAAQAVGKIPVDFRELGAAALTIAGHKFHGPCGIGGLLIRHDVKLEPLLYGGFQQAGLRPGTEPTALAVGMCRALELWHAEAAERMARMTKLRDRLEGLLKESLASQDSERHGGRSLQAADIHGGRSLQAADNNGGRSLQIVVNGESAPRLPHTSNIAFPGLDRQALVMALDLAGVACSTGSACASGSSEPSPVLLAMGCPSDVVSSSLRFSLGAGTTVAEIEESASRIIKIVNDLRGRKESGKVRPPARQTDAKRV